MHKIEFMVIDRKTEFDLIQFFDWFINSYRYDSAWRSERAPHGAKGMIRHVRAAMIEGMSARDG